MTLKVWATLYALNALKRNLNTPCNLRFKWNKPDRLETFEQEYYMEDADKCIVRTVEKIRRLGIEIVYNENCKLKEEVKSNDTVVEEVLIEIEKAEKKLGKDFTLEELRHLMTLYQKVIEHYAETGDKKVEAYLCKLHDAMKFVANHETSKSSSQLQKNKK